MRMHVQNIVKWFLRVDPWSSTARTSISAPPAMGSVSVSGSALAWHTARLHLGFAVRAARNTACMHGSGSVSLSLYAHSCTQETVEVKNLQEEGLSLQEESASSSAPVHWACTVLGEGCAAANALMASS